MEYKKQERQRLTKTVNGTTLSYVYDGLDLLYAKEGDTVTEKNIIEDDGSMILSCRGTVPYWYRQDVRGSVTNIIDGGGTVQKSYTYDAYGNTTAGTEAFENHHAYTGAYMDDETGLYYLSSRYYDPKTGSFTSADSYRGEGEGYWQLYAYCEGDPVNYSDLSGHKARAVVYYGPDHLEFATGRKRQWEKSGTYKVSLVKMRSASYFKDHWNKLSSSYKFAAIFTHGGPHGFDTFNGSVWSAGAYNGNCKCKMGFKKSNYKKSVDVITSSLSFKKSITSLTIASCSAGHKDHKQNIARALWYRIKGRVCSCDGGVSYQIAGYRYPKLSKNQAAFYKYCNKKREPTGFYWM